MFDPLDYSVPPFARILRRSGSGVNDGQSTAVKMRPENKLISSAGAW